MATIGGNNSYYIYIRQQKEVIHKHVWSQKPNGGGGGGGNGGKTKPKSSSNFTRVPSFIPGASAINSVLRIIDNGSSVAGATAMLTLGYKTAKTVMSTVQKMTNYVASQSGDYALSMQWDDWTASINNAMHPISAMVSNYMQQEKWAKANQRVSEQRTLLGDTAINTLTKGV